MGLSRGSFPFLIKTSLFRFGSNGAHLFLINSHSSHKLSQLHGFIGSEIYPAPVSNLRSFLEYPTASSAFPFELLELPPKYCPEVCFHHSSELTLSKYIQIITWLCLKLSDGSPPGLLEFSSVSSVAQSCLTLCNIMDYSMPGFLVHHQILELAETHVHRVGDAIQPSQSSVVPFSSCPQSLPASGSFLHIRWPKYSSFNFNISPSSEYSGLISFRIDWFDFLTVQGTLKSLLQHYSSKASVLQHSAFFIVQLSDPLHDYWKNHSFD